MEGRGHGLVLRYYPDFCLDELRKTTETLSKWESPSTSELPETLKQKPIPSALLRLYPSSATLKPMVS